MMKPTCASNTNTYEYNSLTCGFSRQDGTGYLTIKK